MFLFKGRIMAILGALNAADVGPTPAP